MQKDFDNEEEKIVVSLDSVNLGSDFDFDDEEPEESSQASPSKPVKTSKPSSPALKDDFSFEDEEGGLSVDEKIRTYADEILSCMVGGKEINNYALGKLLTSTTPALFRDENHIIFQVLYNYRDKARKISIDEEFLQLYLMRNRKILENARSYIDIGAYGEVDGQQDLAYIAGVVKHFNRLCEMPELSKDEFNLVYEKYIVDFKSSEMARVLASSGMILTDGLRIRGRKWIGPEDSFNYIKKQMAEINGLVDMQEGTGFRSMSDIIMEERDERKKPIKVADFDNLTALNKIYGGIYTGNFYQVLAPPKGGKTKFCTRVCHTAAVKFGTNVSVWAAEGGALSWVAQMRAIHFDYTYNSGVDVRSRKFGVSQEAILHHNFPSKELEDLELSSKLDLASNPDYGSVDCIDRPFNVETFIEDLDTSVKSNNSQLVIIDYLQYIGTEGKMSERERVSEAYKMLLAYCRANNVAVLTPGQYKQDVIDKLADMSSTSGADMRTSGGVSSEVERTPDIIFALWASTQDLLNNSMKIMSMPCRFNKTFPQIPCYVDLEVCDFISREEE